MRYAIIFTSAFCLLCTAANGYAADDQRRRYEEDRQRVVRPVVALPAIPVQRPQSTTQQSTSTQRNNERSQNQRSGTNGSMAQGQQTQPQVVNIDRLKLQPDTPADYQFEPLPTLSIQEGERSIVEEEMKTEPEEAAIEEQQDAVVEKHESTEQTVPEVLDEASSLPGQVVHGEGGNTQFRIVEESNRIIVTQVEVAPIVTGRKSVIPK